MDCILKIGVILTAHCCWTGAGRVWNQFFQSLQWFFSSSIGQNVCAISSCFRYGQRPNCEHCFGAIIQKSSIRFCRISCSSLEHIFEVRGLDSREGSIFRCCEYTPFSGIGKGVYRVRWQWTFRIAFSAPCYACWWELRLTLKTDVVSRTVTTTD